MASTVSDNFAAYCGLAAALRKNITDGDFSGAFSNDEKDAILDLALGCVEKRLDVIGALLDLHSRPIDNPKFMSEGSVAGGA